VFDELGVTDIFRLSRTCHGLYELTEWYWKSMISLSRILKPYVSSDEEVEDFRRMMRTTGAIISGSSALQAFTREQYDDSDLDVYVEDTKRDIVHSILERMGYSRLESNIGTKDSLDPNDGYPGKTEILHVVTYVKSRSNRVVQVIYTSKAPIFAILQFHSTCVLNFITDSKAYCLYPFSTLCEKKTLVCGPTTVKIVDALQKYERRGWTIMANMTIDMLLINPTSEYNIKYRRIDDVFCWSRELEHRACDEGVRVKQTMGCQNFKWRIVFDKYRSYDNMLEGLTQPIEWKFSGRLQVSDE
ncbi:hypothetical protein F5887DRAFT_882091, partial [Amanita rubescens]